MVDAHYYCLCTAVYVQYETKKTAVALKTLADWAVVGGKVWVSVGYQVPGTGIKALLLILIICAHQPTESRDCWRRLLLIVVGARSAITCYKPTYNQYLQQ